MRVHTVDRNPCFAIADDIIVVVLGTHTALLERTKRTKIREEEEAEMGGQAAESGVSMHPHPAAFTPSTVHKPPSFRRGIPDTTRLHPKERYHVSDTNKSWRFHQGRSRSPAHGSSGDEWQNLPGYSLSCSRVQRSRKGNQSGHDRPGSVA